LTAWVWGGGANRKLSAVCGGELPSLACVKKLRFACIVLLGFNEDFSNEKGRGYGMCGVFEQHGLAMHQWAALLREWPANQVSRINIRPTDMAATIDAQGYTLRKWSLIPRWSKDPKLKFATFNARAESLTEKPSFRDAWRRSQRCIIPASAYFEWPVVDGKKQCHRLARQDGSAILFGGLWETWQQGELDLDTFTIITTAAASDIAWVHSRTPLLIDPEYIEQWLQGSAEEAGQLLGARGTSALLANVVTSPKEC